MYILRRVDVENFLYQMLWYIKYKSDFKSEIVVKIYVSVISEMNIYMNI